MSHSPPPAGGSSTHKVVLLGEGRVGKTSIVSRFVKGQFSDTEESTVQANMYSKKKVTTEMGNVDLSIWDTAGQERFHALGPIYYRGAAGAVLVYDITDADTLEKVKMWIKELRQVVGDSIQIVICGNKGDMEKDRAVPVDVAEKLARRESAKHFTTSAKANMNVQEAFEALALEIQRVSAARGIGEGGGSGSKRGGGASAPKSRSNRVKIDLSGADGPTSTIPAADVVIKPEPIHLGATKQSFGGEDDSPSSGGGSANGTAPRKKKKPCCGN